MLFCNFCGGALNAEARFCGACGAKASMQSENINYNSAPTLHNKSTYQSAQSTSLDEYNRNRKHFQVKTSYIIIGIVCITIGIIVITIGTMNLLSFIEFAQRTRTRVNITMHTVILAFGVVCAILGAYNLYLYETSKVSGDEIDRFCKAQIKNIKPEAMEKLGLDEEDLKESEPIVVSGYNLLKNDVLYKWDYKDGILRSSEYQVTVFFFSKEQVHSFIRVFSVIKDAKFESTDEYFYRDIVSVSTTQEQARGGRTDCFILTTSGGTSITASFSKTDTESINRSINAMRNLIKSKKQAMT